MATEVRRAKIDVDVAILGAGPAGAHAAAEMATRGVNVALIDRRPRGQAGAQWLNGVAAWMLDAAGLARPEPPELHAANGPYRMIPPLGDTVLKVPKTPVWEVDMRRFGERCLAPLEDRAPEALLWGFEVQRVELDERGRPRALEGRQLLPDGTRAPLRVEASLFVDASGLGAIIRRAVPALDAHCPALQPRDLCTAAADLYHIQDRDGAQRFLDALDAQPGENLAWVGAFGGYSLLRVTVAPDLSEVSVLTGSVAQASVPSGRKILDGFVAREPWVGGLIYGGARAIPIRRPYAHLVAPGVALLGDAGCQVYASHGSGISIGVLAARMLADAVVEAHHRGEDLGSIEALWRYAGRFHGEWGAALASSDALRRFTQSLNPQQLSGLVQHGLTTANMVKDALAQRPASIPAEDLPGVLYGVLQAPGLALKMLPLLLRLPLLRRVADAFPRKPASDLALQAWDRALDTLLDGVADLKAE